MSYSLNRVSGMELDVMAPAALPPQYVKKIDISTRSATWREIATVELPMLGLILLVFAISMAVTPQSSLRITGSSLPSLPCPIYFLTHIPCLFCGLTRSFMSMGGLDLRQAFIFHPLGPFFYAGMLATGGALAWSAGGRRRIAISLSPGLRKHLIAAGSVLIIAAWVIKLFVWSQAGLL